MTSLGKVTQERHVASFGSGLSSLRPLRVQQQEKALFRDGEAIEGETE